MTHLEKKISKREAIRALWNRGNISYKLHEGQEILNSNYKETDDDIITILCARRFGKSFWLLTLAVASCLKKKYAIVKYACPKQKQVKTIIKPIMRTILNDCPEEFRPEWREADKIYVFPNGSEIQIAGTDGGNAESLRGGASDLCIVDEAGFCTDLDYVIQSILAPTTDTTDGKIILASTPSRKSDHEFIQLYVKPAMSANKLKIFTIDDNPLLTEKKKEKIKTRYPLGEEDPQYKREYLCIITNDDDDLVIPKFEEIEDRITKVIKRPPYFDYYVSGDIGFKDLTVFLFAYYDFINARLIIEDELVIHGSENLVTSNMAKAIKEKEAQLYTDPNSGIVMKPFLRVMDNDLKLINDLNREHNLFFKATEKDKKEHHINITRMMLSQEQVIINPKCKHLLYHIKYATWDKNRKSFERMGDSPDKTTKGGHADALDALIYLVRNLVKSKNPYPKDWNQLSGGNVQQSQILKLKNGDFVKTIKQILNIQN
jgi:hypothetical protein